jgi:hypothetical protein
MPPHIPGSVARLTPRDVSSRLAVALGERDTDSLDFYAGPAEFVRRRAAQPAAACRD